MLKDMLHQFPPIDIDLDKKREPCLEFDMHEAEMLIKEIEVIVFAFAVYCVKGKQPVVMFFRLQSLAVFHY